MPGHEAVPVENLPVVQNHLIERARREEGAQRPLVDIAMYHPEILGTQADQEIFVSAQERGGIEKQSGQQSGAGAHICHYGGVAETAMPDEDIEQFRRIAWAGVEVVGDAITEADSGGLHDQDWRAAARVFVDTVPSQTIAYEAVRSATPQGWKGGWVWALQYNINITSARRSSQRPDR